MASSADRKAAERARKAARGLKRLELWLPVALHERVKRYAARLEKHGATSV
jgi:hypothetical protein